MVLLRQRLEEEEEKGGGQGRVCDFAVLWPESRAALELGRQVGRV